MPQRWLSTSPAATSSPSFVNFAVDDKGVALITLNNPAKRNPLSTPVLRDIQKLIKEANDSQAVRTVVLASTGPVFSSGHDVREFTAETPKDKQMAVLRLCSEVNIALRHSLKPTIASVQGLASAAGLPLCFLFVLC